MISNILFHITKYNRYYLVLSIVNKPSSISGKETYHYNVFLPGGFHVYVYVWYDHFSWKCSHTFNICEWVVQWQPFCLLATFAYLWRRSRSPLSHSEIILRWYRLITTNITIHIENKITRLNNDLNIYIY